MTDLESYINLKAQYDNMQLKLKKLDDSWKKYFDICYADDHQDKKDFNTMRRIEGERFRTRSLIKSISYKLLIMDYQETGVTISELSKKYNVGPHTIRKLFKANNIAYIPAQMLRWRPIGSAPKDKWILAYQLNGEHGGIKFTGGHCYVCKWAYDNQFWYDKMSNVLDEPKLKEKAVTYLTCVPTYWMPLPEPPK
jgi:hypothetical protein